MSNVARKGGAANAFEWYGNAALFKDTPIYEPWEENVIPFVARKKTQIIKSLADLADERVWVAWREEEKRGKLTKVPKNPAGGNARVPTDPATYGTRAAAEKRGDAIKNKGAKGGIGIVLGELPNGQHLVGSDLDSCRDANGKIAGWAEEVIERLDTYAEVSPSGTGVKPFFLMSADDMRKLHALLGHNNEGKQLTRKAFAAGKHREVALDTARFYAVTGQRLKDSPKGLRLVAFGDVEWFIKEAGPNYLAKQKKGNGKNSFEAHGDEHSHDLDMSGSGHGFRFMQDCHAKGMSEAQAREAILADEGEAGEWANRSDDGRQLQRAWENSKPKDGKAWPVLGEEALYGLAGKVVRMFEPHTEADPVALLLQFHIWFGNALGRGPYYLTEGDKQFANLFGVLVGQTAKARKGTSAGRIRQLMSSVDSDWVKECIKSGLSSGEGVVSAIRDEVTKTKDGNEVVVDEGVDDKRLLVDEREFYQALGVMKREGNVLSSTLREAWDSHPIGSLTKTTMTRCAEPHLSVSAHITEDELRSTLDHTSISNGYANRFLFACVRRSKFLPRGGNLEQSAVDALGKEIDSVYKEFGPNGKGFSVHMVGSVTRVPILRRITMDVEADAMWDSVYHSLSKGRPGMLGAITGRAETQTLRLALLYAVLDRSEQIKVVHLKAAMALWKYCEDSARYIFGDNLGDPLADELMRALRNSGEMSRTQIRDLFKRNQSSDKIDMALEMLTRYGKARCEMRAKEGARGGPKQEFWFPAR